MGDISTKFGNNFIVIIKKEIWRKKEKSEKSALSKSLSYIHNFKYGSSLGSSKYLKLAWADGHVWIDSDSGYN